MGELRTGIGTHKTSLGLSLNNVVNLLGSFSKESSVWIISKSFRNNFIFFHPISQIVKPLLFPKRWFGHGDPHHVTRSCPSGLSRQVYVTKRMVECPFLWTTRRLHQDAIRKTHQSIFSAWGTLGDVHSSWGYVQFIITSRQMVGLQMCSSIEPILSQPS